jgi:WD40 repeat protein
VGYSSGLVEVLEGETGARVSSIFIHLNGISAITTFTSAEGRLRAVSGDDGGAIILWDAADAKMLRTMEGDFGQVRKLLAYPSPITGAPRIASLSGHFVRTWDGETGAQTLCLYQAGLKLVTMVYYTKDGRGRLALASPQGMRVYDEDTGNEVSTNPLQEVIFHQGIVAVTAFEAGGGEEDPATTTRLLVAVNSNQAEVRVLEEGKPGPSWLARLQPDGEESDQGLTVTQMAVVESLEGWLMGVTAHHSGRVMVWDLGEAPERTGPRAATKEG